MNERFSITVSDSDGSTTRCTDHPSKNMHVALACILEDALESHYGKHSSAMISALSICCEEWVGEDHEWHATLAAMVDWWVKTHFPGQKTPYTTSTEEYTELLKSKGIDVSNYQIP